MFTEEKYKFYNDFDFRLTYSLIADWIIYVRSTVFSDSSLDRFRLKFSSCKHKHLINQDTLCYY